MDKIGLFAAAFLALSQLSSAQAVAGQPSTALPAEILGSPLIVWSEFQKPQPVSQPLPPADRNNGDQGQQSAPPSDSQTDQPTTPVFTGTIVKEAGIYALKTADRAVYQLDDQKRAKAYEGKQVRISGSLDANGSLLHVTRIELLS